jgi:hypothetical protein
VVFSRSGLPFLPDASLPGAFRLSGVPAPRHTTRSHGPWRAPVGAASEYADAIPVYLEASMR